MFVSHPDTVSLVREMDRLGLVAASAEVWRAAAARWSPTERPAAAATIQRRLGSVLVTIGQRLGVAEPAADGRAATAQSGTAS